MLMKSEIFQGFIVRAFYLLHSLIILWRVVVTMENDLMWMYSLVIVFIIVEWIFILLWRKAKEFKWFSSCILVYSTVNVPSIWQLELFRSSNTTTTTEISVTRYSPIQEHTDIPIQLDDNVWVYILEQTFLLFIIFGRWILPRNSLSRDKLSSLLLLFIGKACDITDFFTLINETEVQADLNLVYAILTVWTVSIFQFSFVLTEMKRVSLPDASYGKCMKLKIIFLGTDIWNCVVSVLMEELPFLVVRSYTLATHNITSYSTLFFVTKNSLLLMMLLYRICSVSFEIYKGENDEESVSNGDVVKENINIIKSSLSFHRDQSTVSSISLAELEQEKN